METAANDDVPVKEIFPELTRDVIDRMKNAGNPRLREVLALVVRHVHAIVREAEITHDEWWLAIDFLTRAGKMCSENRQEFILLSDILGVSMLVDAIDHVGGPGLSESTVLGLSTPGSSGSSSPATAFFCGTRIAIRWRCTAALRILMAGRSPGQSWRSGRPHPTSYTTSRTRTSRRAIYAAPDPERRSRRATACRDGTPSLPAGPYSLHDRRTRLSHPRHAPLPGRRRISGKRCRVRREALSRHPPRPGRRRQHGRVPLRACRGARVTAGASRRAAAKASRVTGLEVPLWRKCGSARPPHGSDRWLTGPGQA
jgi:hypothetical protein